MATLAVEICVLAENRLYQVAVDITTLSSTLVVTSKESYAIVSFLEDGVSYEAQIKIRKGDIIQRSVP